MATQDKNYSHLMTQDGNYIVFTRAGHDMNNPITKWPVNGNNKDKLIDCLVITELSSPGVQKINFRSDYDDADRNLMTRKYLCVVGSDYQFDMYGVEKWIDKGWKSGDIVWHEHRVWEANSKTTTGDAPPSPNNSNWFEIVANNSDRLDVLDVSQHNTYFYRPVYTPTNGNITIVKKADHHFEIRWNGSGQMIYYVAKDYNLKPVAEGEVTGNVAEFFPEEDGAYSIEITLDYGMKHYAEIYDFTDVEKCYLDLMKNTLCQCLDCNDCPGDDYDKALNYANTYIMLRDVIYSDQSVLAGLTSTDTLRKDFIQIMGTLIKKLKIMASKCSCDNNTDNITVR